MIYKNKLIYLYSLSILISGISAIFYYKYIYGSDYLINTVFIAIFIVPVIFFALSVLYDKLFLKEANTPFKLTLSLIYLPLLISTHFIIITYNNMRGFSEAIFLWYLLLFLPILLIILFAHIVYKLSIKRIKTYIFIKYILVVILYCYGYLIFVAYGLNGMGV